MEESRKQLRRQVNKIIGREISDAEFESIDFSGAIEEAELFVDDLPKLPWSLPSSIIVGGIACDLLGISIHTSTFLCIVTGLIISFYPIEIAMVRRRKRAVAKRLIMDSIRKYEERKRRFDG